MLEVMLPEVELLVETLPELVEVLVLVIVPELEVVEVELSISMSMLIPPLVLLSPSRGVPPLVVVVVVVVLLGVSLCWPGVPDEPVVVVVTARLPPLEPPPKKPPKNPPELPKPP